MKSKSDAGALATIKSNKRPQRRRKSRPEAAIKELVTAPIAAPSMQQIMALTPAVDRARAEPAKIDAIQTWLGFYRAMIVTAQRLVATCDVSDRANFTRGFWIISQLATSRTALARHLKVPEATMTRWTTGATAPAQAVRRAFLVAALEYVQHECDSGRALVGRRFTAEGKPEAPPIEVEVDGVVLTAVNE